jgi:hypothetical protein
MVNLSQSQPIISPNKLVQASGADIVAVGAAIYHLPKEAARRLRDTLAVSM